MGYLEDAEQAIDQQVALARQRQAQKVAEQAAKLKKEQEKQRAKEHKLF